MQFYTKAPRLFNLSEVYLRLGSILATPDIRI